jgi:membrane-associated phospholipid phosphatase
MSIPRTSRDALLGAGFLTVVFAGLWYAVFHIGYVQRLDVSVYRGFGSVRGWHHLGLLSVLLSGLINPGPYLVLCAVPFGIALRRRRPVVALGIVAIVLGANGTTELLKHLIDLPRGFAVPAQDLGGTNSFPSGHATAAMTLALCAVLASPPRMRPAVAVFGSIGALAVVYAVLVLGWHYPSDTLAGLLVASIWTLVGVAVIRIVEARMPRSVRACSPVEETVSLGRPPRSRMLMPAGMALAAFCGVGAVALLLRPAGVLYYARVHTSLLVVGITLAVLGIVLATGVMATTMGFSLSASGRGARGHPGRHLRRG